MSRADIRGPRTRKCPRHTVRVISFLNSPELKQRPSGDVMSFLVFGQVVVVLSSSKAIKDLLELRGETYSDRPSFPLHQM